MKVFIALLSLFFLSLSCVGREDNLQEQEKEALSKAFNELYTISVSVKCTNGDEWKFAPAGDKPCGGPATYIPYHKSIDEAMFLKLVEDYSKAHKAYNEKWGAVSDCSITPMPKSVSCVDGKPVFNL